MKLKFRVWDNVDYMSNPFTLQDLVMNKVKFTPECIVMQQWEPSHGLTVFTDDLIEAECSPSGSNKKARRICKITHDNTGMGVAIWYKKEWWGIKV